MSTRPRCADSSGRSAPHAQPESRPRRPPGAGPACSRCSAGSVARRSSACRSTSWIALRTSPSRTAAISSPSSNRLPPGRPSGVRLAGLGRGRPVGRRQQMPSRRPRRPPPVYPAHIDDLKDAMLTDRTTLSQLLIEERRHHPGASGELNSLILDVALACKAIARRVAYGELDDCAGARALDGSSNIDVNASLGSIFSILRAPNPGASAAVDDFLQPGSQQVCAGYAIYGPSTVIVLTVGTGVHGFTLEPQLGEFVLTHPAIQLPATTSEFAIIASNSGFWEPAVQRYVDECIAGRTGPRAKDFKMRWVASLVAEAHRILTRSGVFRYPRDTTNPAKPGRLRLLYEAVSSSSSRRAASRAPGGSEFSTSRRTTCTSGLRSSSVRTRRPSASSSTTATTTWSSATRRSTARVVSSAPTIEGKGRRRPCQPSIQSSPSPALRALGRPR